jgi:hypothetical protein
MYQQSSRWAYLLLVSLTIAQSSLALENTPNSQPEPTAETIIEDQLPEKNDVKVSYFKEKSADQLPGDAAMLFHIPGLTLTENSGPLSSSQIRYRGLANSRFPVYLEGLSLNNPINGLSDANAMFLFAAKNLQTNAQSLSITLPKIDRPQAKGVFGYGSHNAIKLGGMAGTPLGEHASIFMAMQTSSTNGKFAFSSPDLPKSDANSFTRDNNDQHRLQALVKLERQTPTDRSHALLAFNAHEGGLPGFAFSPTKNLRNRAIFSGLSIGAAKKIKKSEFSITIANSLFDYRTTQEDLHDQRLMASTHELTLGFERLELPSWLDFDFAEQFVVERAYQLNKTRIGGGFLMHRRMQWQGKLKPSSFANFSMLGFNEHGLIFKKEFGVSIEPRDYLSITGRFMRSQRLPTFMEMYAQNSFFVGNPDLQKESILDLELGTTIKIKQHTRIQVAGFFGYLSDLIVDVPFLATMLRPVNIDTARRYGFDVGLTVEPVSWLMFESKNSLLNSKIKSTEAPLPHAPWFSGLTKIRFGNEEIAALTIQTRYRGKASANLHGTLNSRAYSLVDALFSTNIIKHIGLSLSVSNIFNTKTARDTYEMPLPGTVFFGQIEVGNI